MTANKTEIADKVDSANKIAVVKRDTPIDRYLKKYWEDKCGKVVFQNAYGEPEERDRTISEID